MQAAEAASRLISDVRALWAAARKRTLRSQEITPMASRSDDASSSGNSGHEKQNVHYFTLTNLTWKHHSEFGFNGLWNPGGRYGRPVWIAKGCSGHS